MGLHGNEDITERRGTHLPLMDLHERSLSVLACSCVDEVVIGAALLGSMLGLRSGLSSTSVSGPPRAQPVGAGLLVWR